MECFQHACCEHWNTCPCNTAIEQKICKRRSSEALPVDNCGTRLIILALGNPHLLESAEGRKDRTPNPHGVLALRRCHNLDLHGGRRQCGELLCHALANASKHGCTTGQHNIGIQVLANVHITFHDGLESCVVNATRLFANETWLEQHLRAAETLRANSDDIAVWQLISFPFVGALTSFLHFRIEVKCDVAELFL